MAISDAVKHDIEHDCTFVAVNKHPQTMIGDIDHDSALENLFRAGDNLGESGDLCYGIPSNMYSIK